jgi:hypothetical protein
MNLCVLSCCYEKPELAAILTESCERSRLPVIMCAAKELDGVWPASGDMRVGKLVAALECLKLIKETNAFSHVLWADGFDAFLQRPGLAVLNKLDNMGCPPLVLSAEKNCWPDAYYAGRYPKVDSEYRFINAGTWLGQVGYLVDVLTDMVQVNEPNDQRLWTQFYLDRLLPGAVIDTERKIFQTMWGTELSEVSPDACVIHYNGGVWRDPTDTRMRDHWESVKAGVKV